MSTTISKVFRIDIYAQTNGFIQKEELYLTKNDLRDLRDEINAILEQDSSYETN